MPTPVCSISFVSLSDEGAISIGKLMKVSASVTELLLGGNEIGDQGATAIANAIAVNASLTELWCARFLTKPS